MKKKTTAIPVLICAVLVLSVLLIFLAVSLISLINEKRGETGETEKGGPAPEQVETALEPVPTGTNAPETVPPRPEEEVPEFKADLSGYEPYMTVDSEEYLILVNAKNTIDETYLPDDLTDVSDTRKDGRNVQKMRLAAEKALEAMFIEARANGFTDLSVTSAYRSFTYQSQLFSQYTQQEMANDPSLTKAEAEAITETYSARPGTSEHQTGLCCDLHNLPSADKRFASTPAAAWLKENCWKFGFILRYPENKTPVTGIDFEPWHFRFVGRKHAKAIMQNGLCLEEYVASIGGDQ